MSWTLGGGVQTSLLMPLQLTLRCCHAPRSGPAAGVHAAAWVWLCPFPGMGRKLLGLASHAYSTVMVKEPLL